MSLSIALLHKDVLVMSGDSRVSVEIDGKYFAIKNSEFQKIKQIGNKVIFIGGVAEVAMNIISDFESSANQSLEYLQQITMKHKNEHIKKHGIIRPSDTAHAILLIGCIEDGIATLYSINSKNNCELIKRVGTSKLDFGITGPVKQVEVAKELYNEYAQIGADLLDVYKRIYDGVADEEIGGTLKVFTITKNRIDSHIIKILDSRSIKEVEFTELKFNDEKLEFTANGQQVLWFDIPNEKFMFKGLVTASEIHSSHIKTNPDSYPYCEMSATNNIFKAAKAADSYIQIEANSNEYNSPIIYHVNGSVAAFSGIQGNGYFIGVANGSLDLSTSNGNINLHVGTGYKVNINNLKPAEVDFYTSTVSGLLQSDVSGLVARLMAIEARLAALES